MATDGCSDSASGEEEFLSGAKCKQCSELSMRHDYVGSQECMVSSKFILQGRYTIDNIDCVSILSMVILLAEFRVY